MRICFPLFVRELPMKTRYHNTSIRMAKICEKLTAFNTDEDARQQ
jgi:hypothetical protein